MASTLSSLFGGQPARIAIKFADADTRTQVVTKPADGKGEQQYLFSASDNIIGTVGERLTARLQCREETADTWPHRRTAVSGGGGCERWQEAGPSGRESGAHRADR